MEPDKARRSCHQYGLTIHSHEKFTSYGFEPSSKDAIQNILVIF
jgi:hypothetical protein